MAHCLHKWDTVSGGRKNPMKVEKSGKISARNANCREKLGGIVFFVCLLRGDWVFEGSAAVRPFLLLTLDVKRRK